jgi:hypothetical protein
MHRDFKELLSAFNEGHVKYLVVGGYAVSMHAEPCATKDLDILVGADGENATAALKHNRVAFGKRDVERESVAAPSWSRQ